MQLSRRSRQKFADFAAGSGTVRRIEDVYAAQGFDLPANFKLPETGQRRAICAAAEAGADISDPAVAQRLLRVYLDAIDDWGRAQATWGSENAGTLSDDARALLRSLQQDGAPVDDEGALNFASTPSALPVARFERLEEPRVLLQHLERINDGILRDPAAAIGAAKELVESTCRFILRDYDLQYDEREASLTDLYKLVAEQLALTREAVPESAKGSRSSQRILQNLATAVQSLAELRNELGIGHGRTAPSPALARHARLAANAARTVVEFLLETWHGRKASESSAALNVSS
ncbi:MAG: abortive infection family protein [Solirubrobacteraceae bacterium]